MPQDKSDNIFNNPNPQKEGKKGSALAGLFNKLKSKGEEIKAAGREFQADKKAIADLKTGISVEQNERLNGGHIDLEKLPGKSTAVAANGIIKPASKEIKPDIKEKVVVSAKRWHAPKILKTNLIRGEVTTFIDWKKNFLILTASFLLSALIIAVIYIGLVFWEIKEIEKAQGLDDELRALSQGITKTEEEMKSIDTFESKLVVAEKLLDSHIKWTNYINFLEENLLNGVSVEGSISADISGEYSLALKGKNYSDIDKQIKVFKNSEFVKEVWAKSGQLTDAQKDELLINRGVSFNLEFKLIKDFFIK